MAKVAKGSSEREEQKRWNRILRREGLSMDRARPNKLTYVNPDDLANIPDQASDPATIIEAIEKVKRPSIVDFGLSAELAMRHWRP